MTSIPRFRECLLRYIDGALQASQNGGLSIKSPDHFRYSCMYISGTPVRPKVWESSLTISISFGGGTRKLPSHSRSTSRSCIARGTDADNDPTAPLQPNRPKRLEIKREMASRAYVSPLTCRNCLHVLRLPRVRPILSTRYLSEETSSRADFETGSFRKELKEERKSRSREKRAKRSLADCFGDGGWVVTCGLEIHAQLNTRRKLFSGPLFFLSPYACLTLS